MNRKPNIIIINPDEMRWDTMRHMGNAAAVTPALDNFAFNDAVSFSNAYCQNPVCVPSRCSFFTGLYPHTTGHRTMGYLLREQETSLLKELKDAGYYVWTNARNDLVAGQYNGLIESHVTEMFYGGNTQPAPGAVSDNPRGLPGTPGFYSFCNGELKTDENGFNYTTDDEDVDAAVQRILHPADNRPLCIFLGLLYPHPPYNVEEPFFSAIDRSKLPPRIRAELCSGKAKMLDLLRRYMSLDGMSEEQWDELRAIYLGMVAKVDAQLRKILDALRLAGEYDNSLIVFMSDHGDYAGDYNVIEKAQNCFEDVLTRVPLLIKPPKGSPVDPGVTDSLVELVDFYATVLDYAGVSPSHSHFGKSLAPILADRKQRLRSEVFCEGGRRADEMHCSESVDPAIKNGFCNNVMWPRYAAQFDNHAHAKGAMVRTEKWKYVYRAHGDCELYDMEKDPHELRNLAADPAFLPVMTELKEKLLLWYQDTADVVPFEKDERFSKEMVWEKVKNFCPVGYEEDVRQKIENGMSLFPAKFYCLDLQKKLAEEES